MSSSKLIRAEPATLIPTLSSEKYGVLAKDRVRVNVPHVNLLVDSLNEYGFDTPSDSVEVEAVEDDADEPGKILLANDGDIDMDGIPDYADGYDLLAGLPDDDASPGVSFVPVVFEIPEPIDVAEAVVRLSYSASDPGAVTTNELGGYVLPSGHLRLWAKDGSQQRSTNLVWRAVTPGDYLPPTPEGGIPATALGFSNSQRSKTFYAEAIRPSALIADIRILFEVDPDGDATSSPGFIAADAVRLTAVQMEFIIPDENGGKLPTRFVPVSDPHPVVTLAELTDEDVEIANGTATFSISGEVADAIADNIPNHLADIETIRILVNDEEAVVPTALEAGDGGAASFWRRHPFKGLFADLEVSVPAEGVHVVTVETSANAAGSRGQDSLLLSFHSAEEAFFGGTNFVANIYIATNLTNTVTDTIQYYHGDGEPYEEDPWLAETAVASLVFTGRMEEVGMEIDISGFSGLTTNVDMFTAVMHYNISTNYQPVYSNVFVETSATSGLFRSTSAFTVGRGDLTVEVRPLDGTLPGTCVPTVERVKGPADLLGGDDCTLEFMGSTFELEEEDGWFYPKGGSPRFWVVTDGDLDPDNTYLISYEPNGTMVVTEAPDLFQNAYLDYNNTSLFGRKIMLLNIDLKGYEAWRSAERENMEVPRNEEEQPGFLVTAEVDAVCGVDPLEAKIVAAALPVAGGLTRWLRFSDPTKVALTRGGKTFEIPAPSMELQIDGDTTEDAAYQICMLDPEAWAADTSVTVEYYVRDAERRKLPGADKVQLLRPVIVAIGDSLTFGYMADAGKTNLTQNWEKNDEPGEWWDQYPTTELWSEVLEYPRTALGLAWPAVETDIANQGWRGYLRKQLPGFLWAGETANNTGDWSEDGHGPKHCGYSGAKIGHIVRRLNPQSDKQSRPMPRDALELAPCYAIVICFIGANDCNDVEKTGTKIGDAWESLVETKILSLRQGRGRTLLVGVTIPHEADPRDKWADNNTKRIIPLNKAIKEYVPKKGGSFMKYVPADCSVIAHSRTSEGPGVPLDDGLHFLPSGYSQIQTNILAAIMNGFAGKQIAR